MIFIPRIKGPKFQRGIICATAIYGAPGGTVTVTGFNGVRPDGLAPYNSQNGIWVRADGTIDEFDILNGGSPVVTQRNASTDWIIPNGAADGSYDVRVTSVTHNGHSGWWSTAAADDAWIALSADRLWTIRSTVVEDISTDFTLEIRKDGGAALDSAVHQVRVWNFV